MNPFLVMGIVCGVLYVAGVIATAIAIAKAEPGYQDEKGFHPTTPTKK